MDNKIREFSKEVLYDLYIKKNMTMKDICKLLKTSSHTLQREITRHGLNKKVSDYKKTHNMSNTRPYRIWQGMKTRCNNEKEPEYPRYGGKGITYDSKWEVFEGFWEDMQEGYSDDKTLDRINSKGNYEKYNCRWATYEEQNNNKKDNIVLEYKGKQITPKELINLSGLSQTTIYRRIKQGWSAEKIISTPAKTKNRK